MSKNSYKAQLNYYDSKWGWKSEGTASQGQWDGTGVRTGVLYFPGLAALKGKIINGVKLNSDDRTDGLWNSDHQNGIHLQLRLAGRH